MQLREKPDKNSGLDTVYKSPFFRQGLSSGFVSFNTAQPNFMDTRLMQTPHYYRQFSLSLGKAITFSLNSTQLIWTAVNMDNRHFFPAQQIRIENQPC